MQIRFQVAERGHGPYRHLAALRWIMCFIFVWFAIQKFSAYAAESIQPLIANSPFMSWLGMFGVRGEARVLGSIELTTATFLALGARFPLFSALGAAIASGTFVLTTSFILTTPGITQWSATGFPIVSTLVEQFLIKDIALLGVCVVLLVSSIRSIEP
ncbi:DUF417 family protein [Pinirhizobacter sp.]|jgi:uncharacterized membrane protein YkgB|uniref:DUF417 family protein n=1 Tax=Pinirhizobacter sp. TaxID=2950432 RepID=UPI002F4132AC